MKRAIAVLLTLGAVGFAAVAAAEPQLPKYAEFSKATWDAVHAQFAAEQWTPGMDCGRTDQAEWERDQIERGRLTAQQGGPGILVPANGDNDATHYARGSTMIIHVFINHTGGTWDVAERDAAGVKARDAKDFYVSHRPGGAALSFDNEGGTGYLFYNPTLAYNIPADGMTWAMSEDALAALGFGDSDSDGARVDDATYFIQDTYDVDNVIFDFQPADITGRAFAAYGYARIINYTDDGFTTWRHEMGHSFGSCDEYVESGHCNGSIDCGSCQGTYLPAVVSNGNCQLAGCPSHVSCVMINNTDAICSYTNDHWGWNFANPMNRILTGGGTTPVYETGSGGWWTWNSTVGGFGHNQTTNTWAVVGVRPPAGTDYDLRLYNDNNHNHQLASSSFGGSTTDFVVSDYHHSQVGIEHWQMVLFSGAQNDYRTQYESGSQVLYPDGVSRAGSWGATDLVRAWDVPLFAGEQISFVLSTTSGTPDLNFALYKSNGTTYHAGRSASVASSSGAGAGGTESFTYTVPADDIYGLVVWSDVEVAGSFTIQIGPTPATLAEETPFYSGLDLRLFNYNAPDIYWAYVATRPDAGVDVDLSLYSESTYQTLLKSATLYGAAQPEWFMVDYNHAPLGLDYLRVNRVVDPGNHRTMWEQDPETISGIGPTTAFTSPTLGKVWDVNLTAGTNYYFRSYQTLFDNGMYLYRSTPGNYYQARQDFETFSNNAGDDEYFNYTPPTTDWYGLLMPVFSESSGSAGIWIGPDLPLTSDVTLARSDQVVWTSAPVSSVYWNVFGVRPSSGGEANVSLYLDDTYDITQLAASDQGGVQPIYYVVGDFNHSPTGTVYPRYWRDSGSSMTMEWEGGSDALAFVTNGTSTANLAWPAGDVAKMWDIFLPANARLGVLIEDLSGVMDLGAELFDSNAGTYYAARGGGVVQADALGVGSTESLYWINNPTADWVGLVVYNKNTRGGNYRIRVVDAATVDVAGAPPASLQMAAAPNPWRDRTSLQLGIPRDQDATVEILDLQGRLVSTVHRGRLPAGRHQLQWDGRDSGGHAVAPGLYMARLQTGDEQRLVKLVRAN